LFTLAGKIDKKLLSDQLFILLLGDIADILVSDCLFDKLYYIFYGDIQCVYILNVCIYLYSWMKTIRFAIRYRVS
jgi:hypothetical protein